MTHWTNTNAAVTLENDDLEDVHRRLHAWNHTRLVPQVDSLHWEQRLKHELPLRVLEGQFIEAEKVTVLHRAVQAPDDPDGFVRWFASLRDSGRGRQERFFEWLAEQASASQMRWFLGQELRREADFDDLVALTQVKLPALAKLELARHYWDEMGQGDYSGMQGPTRERLARNLRLGSVHTVWERLAIDNLMIGLACSRSYAYHSIGALGVVELTSPARATRLHAGLKRLGMGGGVRRYFALHATRDARHFQTWCRDVLRPLAAENPRIARTMAEGALMRLSAGERCVERYRRELGGIRQNA